MTNEFLLAIKHFKLTLDDLEKITLNSMKSAFIHYEERLKYIYDIIKPGYKSIRDKLLSFNNLSFGNEEIISKL
jgi:adenosine deaminase